MKILLLTTHLRMGGVSIYVVGLAKALKRRGHEVFVASGGGELVKKLSQENIQHITFDIDIKSELHPKVLIGLYNLYWLAREKDIDIVHTHTRVTQVMGEALAFFTKARHVSTCHGFFRPRTGRRLCGCWGRKVIAISEAVREHLVNDFKLKKSGIELIHNGIDLGAFKKISSQEERNGIKRGLELKEGPVVGIIARLSSVKGHKFLVSAIKSVIARHKDVQLMIVGEGEEADNLKNQVEELGLSGSVVFIKTVLDTPRMLSIMDIFVLPSIKEGLGLALLEALCCEVPVVASDVGGIYSIVKNNETGLLVPPKDPKALASAIINLLENRALAEKLAAEGQKFVRANFSLEDMADKVEKVYKEVL